MKKLLTTILTLIFTVALNIPCDAEMITGKVIQVLDGDTVKVETEDSVCRIRLACIDAPESKQEAGQYSKYFLTELIKDSVVYVDVNSIDLYGRKVGIIYKDDIDINAEMLKNGFAWHYEQYDKTKNKEYYQQCANYARENRLGLWAQDNPVEPWIWRKRNR